MGTAGVPDTIMVAELKLQLALLGRPEHAKVTCPENPAAPVTLMGALTVWPDWTVSVVVPPGARAKAALITWLSVAEEACLFASPEYEAVIVCVPTVVKDEVV